MSKKDISAKKKFFFYSIIVFTLFTIIVFLYYSKNYIPFLKRSFFESDKFLNDISRDFKFNKLQFEKTPLSISKYAFSRHSGMHAVSEGIYNENYFYRNCEKTLDFIKNKDDLIYLFRTQNSDLNKIAQLNRNNIKSSKKHINKIGTRNREIKKKKKNEIRIILLGGSTTQNNSYVNSSSEYISSYLNKYLKSIKSPRRVNVINAGISGANIIDNYYFFKEQLIQLSPDIVLFKESINNISKKKTLTKVKLEQLISNQTLKLYEEYIPKFINLSKENNFVFLTADMPINIDLTEQSPDKSNTFWDGYNYHTVEKANYYFHKSYPKLNPENFKKLYLSIQKYFLNLSIKYDYHHFEILEYFANKNRIFNDLFHKTELGNNLEGYVISNKLIEIINLQKIEININNSLLKNIYDQLEIYAINSSFNCEKLNQN